MVNQIILMSITEIKTILYNKNKYIELLYVMSGEANIEYNTINYSLKENDFLVIDMNVDYKIEEKKKGLICYLRINHELIKEYINLYENEIRCTSIFQDDENHERIRAIIFSIFENYHDVTGSEGIYLNSLFYNLVYILSTNFIFKRNRTVNDNLEYSNQLNVVLDYINNNYNKQIDLSSTAEQVYFSSAYLSRYMKEKVGKNFKELLTEIRLKHALDDIENTDMTIMKVALENGFPNTVSLNKAFKKAYGVAPLEYKKNKNETQNSKIEVEDPDLEIKIKDFFENSKENPVKNLGGEYVFKLDVSNSATYNHDVFKVMNVEARNLLQANMQDHILKLKKELSFTFVRFWDIYSPDLFLRDYIDNNKYSFSKIDAIFDFLIHNGMKPYMDVGYRPFKAINKNVGAYQPENEIFNSLEDYGEYLTQLIKHCINRYGIIEFESWYFVIFKNPIEQSVEEFLNTFSTAYTIIKKSSLNVRVGASGMFKMPGELITDFIKRVKVEKCQPDFLGLFGYPYEESYGLIEGVEKNLNSFSARNGEYLKNFIQENRKVLFENGFRNMEIHLLDWNFTFSNRNCLNDSIFKSAYTVKNMLDIIDMIDVVGCWHASDLISKYSNSDVLLYGGNGMLTKDGIKKPSFFSWEYLSKLDKFLLGKSRNAIITTNLHDSYTVVCHNYKHPNYKYFIIDEDSIDIRSKSVYFSGETIKLSFELKGVKNGVYSVKIQSLNNKKGSVQDEWLSMNLAENLSKQDIEYLEKICIPRISIKFYEVKDSILSIDTFLNTNEIQYMSIRFQMNQG